MNGAIEFIGTSVKNFNSSVVKKNRPTCSWSKDLSLFQTAQRYFRLTRAIRTAFPQRINPDILFQSPLGLEELVNCAKRMENFKSRMTVQCVKIKIYRIWLAFLCVSTLHPLGFLDFARFCHDLVTQSLAYVVSCSVILKYVNHNICVNYFLSTELLTVGPIVRLIN